MTCNETYNASMTETKNSNNQIVHIWNETSLLDNGNYVELGKSCINAVNTSHSSWLGSCHIACGQDVCIKTCADQTPSWMGHIEIRHNLILMYISVYSTKMHAIRGSFINTTNMFTSRDKHAYQCINNQ